jgi:hypothetical protein
VAGGTTGPGLVVRQPALNVRARNGSSNVSGARVRVEAESPGCGGTWTLAGAGGQTTGTNGMLDDPGVPYGRYDVCMDRNFSGTTRRVTLNNVDVNRPDGTAVLDMTLNTSSSQGACP